MQPSTLDEFRRGWKTLLASAMGNGSGLSGIAFYTFGVFIVPLVTAFGWTRGQVSIAASFMILGTAITAPIIGSIIDRLGAQRVALISMVRADAKQRKHRFILCLLAHDRAGRWRHHARCLDARCQYVV